MQAKLCSIIILVNNKVEYTFQCLESIFTNTLYPNYEIVFVNNGSTDRTAEILKLFKAKIITNNKNLGFSKACNQGAQLASGEYLVFLNNDTIAQPGWLEELTKTAENPNVAIVGSKLLYPATQKIQHAGVVFGKTRIAYHYHIYRGFQLYHPAVNKEREFKVVTAACMLIKKSVFLELGGFDELFFNVHGDVDLCLRAKDRGYKIIYNPRSILYHYEHATGEEKSWDRPSDFAKFFKRWEGKIKSDEDLYYNEDGFIAEYKGEGMPEIKHQEGKEKFAYLVKEGKQFEKDGLLKRAQEKYEECLNYIPDNSEAITGLERLLLMKKDYDRVQNNILDEKIKRLKRHIKIDLSSFNEIKENLSFDLLKDTKINSCEIIPTEKNFLSAPKKLEFMRKVGKENEKIHKKNHRLIKLLRKTIKVFLLIGFLVIILISYVGVLLIDSLLHLLKKGKKPSFTKPDLSKISIIIAGKEKKNKLISKKYEIIYLDFEKVKNPVYLYNKTIKKAKGDLVLLLEENGMLNEELVETFIRNFKKNDLFSVTFKGGKYNKLEFGKLFISRISQELPCFAFCIGLPTIYTKEMFLKLGGFDTDLESFELQNLDLSYRAWKRGWKTLYVPYLSYGENEVIISPSELFPRVWNFLGIPFLFKYNSHLIFCLIKKSIFFKELFNVILFLPKNLSQRIKCQQVLSDAKVLDLISQVVYKNNGRKTILFLCPYIPHQGVHGGASGMFSFIKWLSIEYNVSVLTFVENKEELKYRKALEEFCKYVETVMVKPSYSSQWQKLFHRVNYFYCDEMKNALEKLLQKEKFDIVQVEYNQMGQYNIPKHIKKVLKKHEIQFVREYAKFKTEKQFFKKIELFISSILTWRNEKEILKKFDNIITVSDKERDRIKSVFHHPNVEFCETCVDTDFYKPINIEEERNTLLYVGYYKHFPNEDAVIYFVKKILPLIKKEIPNVKFYIVGSNLTPRVLKLQGDDVLVTGLVPDLRPWFAKCQVFVVPIRTGTGIRGKILKAWAMGKAVVSTTLGISGIDAKEGENVLLADTPQEFAQKVIYLLKNDAIRKKVGESGKKMVMEKYTKQIAVPKMKDIYEKILADKNIVIPVQLLNRNELTGDYYYYNKHYAQALEYYQEIFKLFPKDKKILEQVIHCCWELKKEDDAISYLVQLNKI